ncbi:MAG: leucine-rich repeat domain-containing protein [Chitinophagales bacterium]|nr:leucine-rich repeat domain-containing protein [Chitinophagales bacterium]
MTQTAKQLIAQAKAENWKRLDLGRCGLTDLEKEVPELFTLTDLEELVLSNEWREWNEGEQKWEGKKSANEEAPNKINQLPEALGKLRKLRVFVCGGKWNERWGIKDINPLSGLKALTTLNLSLNQLTDISGLSGLTALTTLYLRNNQLTDISGLSGLTALTTLDLDSNQLTDVSGLSGLTALTTLDLSHNRLTDVFGLSGLVALATLDLQDNQLTDVSGLSGLNALTTLYLSLNQLTDVSGLSDLPALTILYLYNNQLTDVSGLSDLPALTILYLYNNQLTDVSGLSDLPALTTLYLQDNQLTDISGLSDLAALTILDLDSNQLTDVSGLSDLPALTTLDLRNNQLTDVSGLSDLPALTTLDLQDNQLTDISGLSDLPALTTLDLRNNQLTDVSGLSGLAALTILDLDSNQLTDVSGLSGLAALTTLDLRNNQLTDVSGLSDLPALTTLYLNDNKLTDVSGFLPLLERKKPMQFVIEDWTNEGEINVKNNPIQVPPLEIIEQGREAVLRYFAELEKGKEKLLEAKVLLVGQGASGKTSLKVKLMDPLAPLPLPNDTTRTIEISSKEYPCGQEKPLKLNYWDFGGQNIQHYAHQFFLTGNALYVLLSNDREQNPNFEYWLNIIELLGQGSKVLIVQNHKQGHCETIKNAAGIRERFPNVLNPFHGLDISKVEKEHRPQYDALERTIVNEALSIPTVQRVFARSFVRVRVRLEELAADPEKHYITWQEYIALCKEESISEETAQDYANAYTAVGVCLHYPDHYQLCNYVFLRPKWIIDALFDVLYSDDVKNGELDSRRLHHIWQGEQYAPMRGNLLLLLELFELCYRVQDQEHLYIVPQRLPDAQESHGIAIENGVRVQYEYKFMPKGIITRFICRQKNKIVRGKVWNDAVALSYSGETAFVHEVFSENIIKVVATSQHNSDLLNSIVDTLDAIHQSFLDKGFNLKVEKLIPCSCSVCQNEDAPYYFEYEHLQKLLVKGKSQEMCRKSYDEQDIRRLLQATQLKSRMLDRANAIGFVTQHKFYEAFDLLDTLDLQNSTYYRLKKEYISGIYQNDSDYAERLITFLKNLR